MDRLSVALAVDRGRRLFHGQPFVVFALDLRDPLGSWLTRLLHSLGDARSVEDEQKRAWRRGRAPIVTVPSTLEHVQTLLLALEWTPELEAQEGCTFGDVSAVRDFILSHRAPRGGVSVFLAADQERSVLFATYPARGRPLSVAGGGAPSIHEAGGARTSPELDPRDGRGGAT
jgi:hypothetical protein